MELLKQHEKEFKEQLRKLTLGTMKDGKIKSPNFSVLFRLGLTPEKIIEERTRNLFKKKDIMGVLKEKGFKELKPIDIKDYDPFVFKYGGVRGEKFHVFEKDGDGIVTERIYIHCGPTPPVYRRLYTIYQGLECLNRVELSFNEEKFGHFLSKLAKFVKELKRRQRHWVDTLRKGKLPNERGLAKRMMFGMQCMIEDFVWKHKNFFEIMTGKETPETHPYPRNSVAFRIDGCRTEEQFYKMTKFIRLWREILFGLEKVFDIRPGRPVKVQEEMWEQAIEYYYNLKYLCSEACRMEKQIKRKYEEKHGNTLKSISNTDKQQIAKELSKIMKEKGIKGITLGTLDDIEEMATKSPEHTALEKVSKEYDISQSYFKYNRDFREALHYRLFVVYKSGKLYRTLYKGK